MSPRRAPAAAVLAVLAMIVVAISFSSSANAAPYHHAPKLSVSNQNPAQGSTDVVTGAGYVANELVTLTLKSKNKTFTLTTVRANAGGGFTIRIQLPPGVSGNATITGTGATGDKASVKIKIGKSGFAGVSVGQDPSGAVAGDPAAVNGASSGGPLASTGVAIVGLGVLGIALLLGGGGVLVSVRRRRASA